MGMFQNSYELEQRSSSFMAGVYGWMSVALAITAGTAYYLGMSPQFVVYLYTHSGILWGLILAQLAIVFSISFFINRMSFMTALVLFLVYAVSLGITLSSIFFVYSQSSILSTFLTTAGM